MGNQVSSRNVSRQAVIRELWKSERAVPVLPINPNLGLLRVLIAKGDAFQDVGSVHSLCKPGKDDLKDARLRPQRRLHSQPWVISDDDGALARALVGPANANALFANAQCIEVRVPDCEIREVGAEALAEMVRRFHPDLQTLGPPGRDGKHVLFIIHKVLLVSRITITATGLERLDPAVLLPGVNLEAHLRGSVAEFTLSPAQTNQKLPVAFSASRLTYDKFGIREADRREAHTEADADGEEEEEEEEEEQDARNDEDMGQFVEQDWFATLLPACPHEILPLIEGFEDEADHAPGERQEEAPQEAEEEHVVNDQTMEDID